MAQANIPKIIHFCWFSPTPGAPYPELVQDCIDSWKKMLSDYTIMEWNADNSNLQACDYVKEAYEAKKYAFVSDYVRLDALSHYGGIYLDTDVMVLRSFDPSSPIRHLPDWKPLFQSVPVSSAASQAIL